MNFLNIEYFLVTVEEGSFSQAARKLFVSQQSLSEHVKKLENELGVPLLKRGPKLTLTVAGESFVENGKEILKVRDKMYHDIALATSQRRSKITIGIPTAEMPPFLSELLVQFSTDYPQYEVVVKKRQSTDIAHNMQGIDLYFSSIPLDEHLHHEVLLEDDPYVVIGSQKLLHNLYGSHWPSLEHELIHTQNLFLLKDSPFLILTDRNNQMSRDQSIIFNNYDFTPIVGFQSENGDLNASLCLSGIGLLLASRYYCKRKFLCHIDAKEDGMLMFPIKTPGFHSSLVISYETGKHLNPSEKRFIESAKKYVLANP